MLNEFIKFITDDPIMLGLCCAIVFLVIVFILILIFGGKKKEKIIEDHVEDNTAALLKTDLNDEPLRSTQEFTLNDLEMKSEIINTQEIPTLDVVEEVQSEKEAPISLNEAMELKSERENMDNMDTIKIPVINEEPVAPVEIPKVEEREVPQVTAEPVVEQPVSNNQPFSSVYIGNENIAPVENEISASPVEAKIEPPVIEEPVDDIELPMLNKSETTSVIGSLTGESYNIK